MEPKPFTKAAESPDGLPDAPMNDEPQGGEPDGEIS